MDDWLMSSLSGAPHTAIPAAAAWHARLMVLSWSVLLPLGMLIARYLKIWPGQDWPRELDNRRWFRRIVWLQSLGVGAMTLGLSRHRPRRRRAAADDRRPSRARLDRAWLGWLQVLGALLRGKSGGPGEPECTATITP